MYECTNLFVVFYVTHANSLQIDKSTDIDIIIVDDNIVSDKGRTINNNVGVS